MKIVLISDTHELHDQVEVPDGDVLIHAGDFTMIGELDKVRSFDAWLGKLPHKHKIVVAGNHDITFERCPQNGHPIIKNATYLQDGGIDVDGLFIYGSPWTPEFGTGWVFNADRSKMSSVASAIPDRVDVLVTHGPLAGILDRTMQGVHAGSSELRSEVFGRINPKIHVSGHIHEGYGYMEANKTKFFNASVVDFLYRVVNGPWVVEL